MAEIKSTMEKVMERLAAMEEGSKAEVDAEEKVREGMRLGAAYLRGEERDLGKAVADRPAAVRPLLMQGLVKTLLRNIVLPRDEEQRSQAETAIQGLLQVGRTGELARVFQEVKAIVEQYLEHRQQLKDQLKAAFAQQMGQVEQNLAKQTGMKLKVDPAQHPKFREEWQRLQGELSSQYGRALDQHKRLLEQRLTAA